MTTSVLITGATGSIATKLRGHFAELPDLAVRGLCLNPGNDPDVVTADLSTWDDAWVSQFAGADVVIHLAAEPAAFAGWERIIPLNIDLTLNVYEACRLHGVRRIVFASSNWVVAGHRFEDGPLTPDTLPAPVNPYGHSKLFGERLGRHLAERDGISVICFRIGYCLRLTQHHENRPGRHLRWNEWGQHMWLSDRDLCQAFEKAVRADHTGFSVLNLMSANEGMRWDLEPTCAAIGYVPEDGAPPDLSDEMRTHEEAARLWSETRARTDAFFIAQAW